MFQTWLRNIWIIASRDTRLVTFQEEEDGEAREAMIALTDIGNIWHQNATIQTQRCLFTQLMWSGDITKVVQMKGQRFPFFFNFLKTLCSEILNQSTLTCMFPGTKWSLNHLHWAKYFVNVPGTLDCVEWLFVHPGMSPATSITRRHKASIQS